MSKKKPTQKLSIRLLREGFSPETALKESATLEPFSIPTDADSIASETKISIGKTGGGPPKWTNFLQLTDVRRRQLFTSGAYGVLFIKAAERWFAVAFGGGYHKLDPLSFEYDFGLRVVLNTVDHQKLRGADIRTPDENTTSRRTQAARQSPQTVFEIDHERDLVRGLEGEPRDKNFASRISGSDALTLWRPAILTDLPQICTEAFIAYKQEHYKQHFGWIDDIRHERDATVIVELDAQLVTALDNAINGEWPESLHLAWPIIYDPHDASRVQYCGFRSKVTYPDLDVRNYVDELRSHDITQLTAEDLSKHQVAQTDDDGRPSGESFTLRECCIFEGDLDNRKYVLSGGRWYQIAVSLASEALAFFAKAPKFDMPPANDENEVQYNTRLKQEMKSWICLDNKPIKPGDALTPIEICDFLAEKNFIHIKDQAASSKLSHLFNQGYVSARTFKTDGEFRLRLKNAALESSGGKLGEDLPAADDAVDVSQYTVVFAVLRETTAAENPNLPFFSLITFRQAAKQLNALGFRYAFAWVFKQKPGAGARKKRKKE